MKYVLLALSIFFPLVEHASWISYGVSRLYQYAYLSSEYGYRLTEDSYFAKCRFDEKFLARGEVDQAELLEFFRDPRKKEWQWYAGSEGKGSGVGRVLIGGKRYYAKWSSEKGLLKQVLFMNKAIGIWNHAIWAEQIGLPVATPIAAYEKKHLSGSEGIVLFLDLGGRPIEKESARAVEPILDAMKYNHIVHHDLQPKNIIEEYHTIKLIDLDYLHSYPRFSYAWKIRHEREKKRLSAYLETS